MSAPVDAASAIHALGWNVLPVAPRGKRPIVATWERWQTERQPEVPDAFTDHANVGIITGEVSGIVVVDADDDAARDLVIQHVRGALEQTPISKTAKGWHFFFQHPGERRPCRTHVGGLPLDVRGDGGFVVAPPSVHESGHVYTWLVSPFDHPPIEMPESLAGILWPKAEVIPLTRHRDPGSAMNKYASAALDGELASVRFAPEGSRNHALNKAAFNLSRFIVTGELDARYVFEALLVAATRNGLPETEARRTIRSGLGAREA